MKSYINLNFKTFLGLSKRPSTSEASNITPKKAKANETGSESESPLLSSVKPPDDLVLLEKGKDYQEHAGCLVWWESCLKGFERPF